MLLSLYNQVMVEMLLQTKLHSPQSRPSLIKRPHLIQKLNDGLGRRLTLLSAPAGAGKTSLLSQLAAQQRRPLAWLSLDAADDDPDRFWTYVITACQTVLQEIGADALAWLNTSRSLPDETIPTLLINDLVQHDQKLLLILDDYHVIQHPSIHAGLSFLLNNCPSNFHLVVSTRVDPPWPLARYRAQNQLTEIRTRDLRFSLEEAAQFFNETIGLNLTAQDLSALEQRTEGWAAGLQLAAIAMQSQGPGGDAAAFVKEFRGSHLYVADYLLEEILQRQPQGLQTFLLQTSILDRLSAGLCEAVTGRRDAQDMLTELYRANLFVFALDNKGKWFRYHHLFVDLLLARLLQLLPAEDIASLHRQAAAWFEQNGFVREAIRHGLSAKDFERVSLLIEREARAMMFTGQARTLSSWLESLPEGAFQRYPRLSIYQLWIDLMQENSDLSVLALQEKEQMLRALPPSPEIEQLQVELLAVLSRFVAFAGNTTRAIRLSEEALDRLPQKELALRARAHSALAIAHWIEGHAHEAEISYAHCLDLALASGNYSLAAHATMMMGMSQTDYGRLHQAAQSYQSIIDMGELAGQKIFFPAGQGYIGLAGIYLEWNDLETAEDYLQRGMTLCRQGGLAGLSTGHTIKARLHQAQGSFQKAIIELEHLGQTGVDPTGTARLILLRLAMGNLDEAQRSAAPWLIMIDKDPALDQPPLLIAEIIKITLARLFLAMNELDTALQLLSQVQTTAEFAGRNGRLIEVYLLTALIDQKQNKGEVTPRARELFARALNIGEPEGYILLFLEESPEIFPLLSAVLTYREPVGRQKHYIQKLLDASSRDGRLALSQLTAQTANLVEKLTPRELEVLQLMALGDPNRVIAEKLVITVRTVKKHITNILGKLGASNRTQAVVRARELGLISSK